MNNVSAIPGPFQYVNFRVFDANGRIVARVYPSNRIPTEAIEEAGRLLAASWNLRELLGHVLRCSGSPADCETCLEAAVNSVTEGDEPESLYDSLRADDFNGESFGDG